MESACASRTKVLRRPCCRGGGVRQCRRRGDDDRRRHSDAGRHATLPLRASGCTGGQHRVPSGNAGHPGHRERRIHAHDCPAGAPPSPATATRSRRAASRWRSSTRRRTARSGSTPTFAKSSATCAAATTCRPGSSAAARRRWRPWTSRSSFRATSRWASSSSPHGSPTSSRAALVQRPTLVVFHSEDAACRRRSSIHLFDALDLRAGEGAHRPRRRQQPATAAVTTCSWASTPSSWRRSPASSTGTTRRDGSAHETVQQIRGYRFADFSFELAKRRLSGPDGAAIPLSGRAYDVLAYLVENRDRVVGKDELIKAVWPHSIVEDNNLNQAISTVRRALGDSRDTPRFIVTVAGRGYQFIGDVVPLGRGRRRAPRGSGASPFGPVAAGIVRRRRSRRRSGTAASRSARQHPGRKRASRAAPCSQVSPSLRPPRSAPASGGIDPGSDRACRSRSPSCRSSRCCRRRAIRRWSSASPSC